MADNKPSYTPKQNNSPKALNYNSNNNNFYNPKYNRLKNQNYLTNINNLDNPNNLKKIETPIQKLHKKKIYKINNKYDLNDNTGEKNYQNKHNAVHYQYRNKNLNIQNEDINDYSSKSSIIEIKNIFSQRNEFYQNFDKIKQNELLLKIFIYIYYYEKTLSENNIFINSNEIYYLINPNWLDEFKNFYSYNKLKSQLDLTNKTNKYDYRFIDKYINDIIKSIPISLKPNYKLLPKNLKTNILTINKGIIFPQKIMNIIYKLDKDIIKIEKSNRFIFNNNNIYYIKNKTIIFGNYQKNAFFEPIYIFEYNSNEIESNEEKKIINSNINDYIKEKKCNTQINRQVLKNGNNDIGILIIQNLQKQLKKNNFILSQNISLKDLKLNGIFNNDYLNTEISDFNNTTKKQKNNMHRNSIKTMNNIDEGKELLKALIYIYYYEKSLKEKNIFLNNVETYYLINPDWLDYFKTLYLYNNIENILKSKKEISYDNIDSKLDSIINIFDEKNKLEKIQFSESMKTKTKIVPALVKSKNAIYIKSGIIFPSKIMNIIKKVYDELKGLGEKNLIFKDKFIYYINNQKIIVGIYRNSPLLKPKYVFTYNSIDLVIIEKEKMISTDINEYLKQRNCSSQSEYQILKNEKGEEIGSLINVNHPDIKKRNIIEEREKIRYQTIDNNNQLNKNKNLENQKGNELINNNINLNIQIKNLEQQLLNNNIEYEKLKKEYNLVLLSQKNDNHQIENLKNDIFQLKKKEKNIIKDFSELDNKYKNINKSYEQLLEENKNFKIQNSIISKEKENLIDKLKQNEAQISNQKEIINQVDNFNNLINKLNQELEKKNEDNIIINNELVKIKSEKNALTVSNNEKEKEINNLKIEISKLKLNEINLLSIKSNMQSLQKKADNFNDLEKEKNSINQKYNQLFEKNKALENEILQLSEDKKKLSEKIEQYEKQISNQKDIINKNDNINKQLKLKNNQLIENNAIIKEELEKLKKDNKFLQDSNKDKDNELNKLNKNIEQMKKNDEKILFIKNKEQEIDKKIKNLDEKQKYFDSVNEKYSLLEKQNIELENNIFSLQKKKEKLQDDIKKLEGQFSNQNDLIKIQNNLNNEINNLKQQLSQKEKEMEIKYINNKKQIEKIDKENNILNKKNADLENELKNLKNQKNDLEKKQNLVISIKEKEKDIEKISKDLKEKENKIIDLNNQHKTFDKQNNVLKKNISNLIKKKDNLGKEIDELEKILSGKKNIINVNNNLNKQIVDLKAKLKQKDKEIENNNNSNKEEVNKIKNEKQKEINELKQEIKKMIKDKTERQLLQKKEQKISKKMKE